MSATPALRSRLGDIAEETRSKRSDAQQGWARVEAARKRLANDESVEALDAAERAKTE